MSDNKRSPENNDISPIRGLFRQNEEAYNKHQQKLEEEKELLIEKRRREQQKAEEQRKSESLQTKKSIPENDNVSFGGRMKAIFGKIAEIVTQPEDGSFFGEDNDGFEDIYSDEQAETADVSEEEPEREPDGQVYDEPIEAEDEISDVGETVIYQSTADGFESDIRYDEQPEETVKEETQTETADEAEAEKAQDVSENTADNDNAAEKQAAVKTEITLDAVMYAKNAGAEGTPITYVADEKSGSIDNEDKQTPESYAADEVSDETESKDEENSEEILDKKNELSHSERESVNEEKASEQETTNELSHNAAVEDKIPVQKRFNELSHDSDTEAKTSAPRKTKNELSHNDSADSKESVESKTPNTAAAVIKNNISKDTDLSEGKSEPVVYHRSDNPPFIVMAGKFTKTLRGEYESTCRLRGYTPDIPVREADVSDIKKNENVRSVSKNEKPPIKMKKTEAVSEEPQNIKEDSNILQMPKPKNRKRFRIKDLFSAEGDTFDEEEDIHEEKPEITDYQNDDDVAAIRNELNYNFRKRVFRTGLLTCIAVCSAIVSLLAQLVPSLFTEAIHNGWLLFGIVNFILLAIAVFAEKTTICYGLVPLKRFKATSDTAVSVASVAAVIQSVTGLFLPDVYVNGTYHMYSFLVIIALLFNSMGKLIIIKRTADNFRFLCSPKAKYAGKIYTDKNNAQKLISGLPAQRPIIAYTRKSKLMSNFLQLSYASDPIEDNASFFAPFAAVLSLLCGLAYGFLSKDFVGGVSSFALTSFITTPICVLITLNIPIKNLCRSTLHRGSMVVGYEAIKQFSDTNAVMVESNDLYPKGNIILSGIKAFNETKLNTALLAGAAVSFAVDGPMSYIFETIIQDRKHMVPAVESVSYDDNSGLSGWIGGQRILIGNRALMNKHNISLPDESVEAKYHKMGNEISYISMSGELIAMFILTYKVDRNIAASLRELTQNGVNIIVRTIDPNITGQHIADKFGIYQRSIKVLNTGLGNICHGEISFVDETSRAYVVTDGKLSGFAAAVSGCIGIKSTVTISKIVQIVSIVLGFLLANIISFVGGFSKLGGLEVLIYTSLWCLGLIIVSVLARKFN